MASAQANPAVTMTWKVRDEASPALRNMGSAMDEADRKADNLSQGMDQLSQSTTTAETRSSSLFQSFAANSGQFIIAGAAIASASAALGQLGTAIGIIPEHMQQTVSNTIAAVGAIASLAGALGTLVPVIRSIALAERARAVASAIALAFSNPFFALAGLAAAAVVGVGAAALASKFLQTPPGTQRQIPGSSTESQLAMVHGGEIISRPASPTQALSGAIGGGGATTVLNVGVLVADENGLRELERRLGRIRLEERRTRGTEA